MVGLALVAAPGGTWDKAHFLRPPCSWPGSQQVMPCTSHLPQSKCWLRLAQKAPAAKTFLIFFFPRVTHAWNEQVLLIIHRSLVSSLAHCSHTAGDQQCNPGCSKIGNKQQTAPGGTRRAGSPSAGVCLGKEFRKCHSLASQSAHRHYSSMTKEVKLKK